MIFNDYSKGDVAKIRMRSGDMLGYRMSDYTGPSWTMRVEGEVAACAGLVFVTDGIYSLWAIVGDNARGHGGETVSFTGVDWRQLSHILDIHRIQATARADSPEYNRYLQLFGFELEGTARMATPDKDDLNMYGRVML